MKKFICLLALCFIASFSFAQDAMTGNGDTITNTGTKTNYATLKEKRNSVAIQSVITKISGTVAGTVTLQASVDGTNYVTVDTNVAITAVTYTATNVATQSVIFVVNESPYLYYKVSYTGTGTMSATMRSYILGR